MHNAGKRLNWQGLEVNPSSFCLCLIRDEEFSPEPMVLFVFNRAEEGFVRDGKYFGKPPGAGLPGGGVSVDDMDTTQGAAIRELEAETGLSGRVDPLELAEEHWLLITDKTSGMMLRKLFYEKGKQPSVAISSSNQRVILNPFYLYRVQVRWEGSALRQFMLECRDALIANGALTRQDIAEYGLYVDDATDEELDQLGVKEKNEIAGFALLPLSLLQEMSQRRQYFLDPPDNTLYVYRSHVNRVLLALDKLPERLLAKGA